MVWGLHSAVHLHSCYGGTLIGDWWRGIFHRASTSSSTPSLGLPLSPVHGALDEYDWQRWVPPTMPWLITPANGSPPDGLMCIVWIGQTPLRREMRDECVLIRSCVPCTALIIIFIDEYHCRQDDEVAICVQRLSHANIERGLCHWWEIWSCTGPASLVSFQLAFCTHTHSLSIHRSEYTKSIFTFMPFSKPPFIS